MAFPEKRSETRRLPLFIMLQCAGIDSIKAFDEWNEDTLKHGWILLAPRWTEASSECMIWESRDWFKFIDALIKRYPQIDSEQVVISGVSAGAIRALPLLTDRPSAFRAGIFIAFAPASGWAEKSSFADWPPLFFAMGKKDTRFNYQMMSRSVKILKAKGIHAEMLLDENAGHEHRIEWNGTIFSWLNEQMSD